MTSKKERHRSGGGGGGGGGVVCETNHEEGMGWKEDHAYMPAAAGTTRPLRPESLNHTPKCAQRTVDGRSLRLRLPFNPCIGLSV